MTLPIRFFFKFIFFVGKTNTNFHTRNPHRNPHKKHKNEYENDENDEKEVVEANRNENYYR